MKPHRLILLCLLTLAICLPLPACQTTAANASSLSDQTQASLAILVDQLALDDISAMDILVQLRRAGYDSDVRMAFATESENTYRLWLTHAALDVTLDENGLVSSIRDGDKIRQITDTAAPSHPQNPTQSSPEPVENPVDSVENLDNTGNLPVENSPERALTLLSLTSPIEAGKQATLTAQGLPGTEYSIAVRYASGNSTAAGLEPQRADENGRLEWTFRVSSRVAAGEYPVTVSGGGETLTLTLTVMAP